MPSLPPGPKRGLLTTLRTLRDPFGALVRYAEAHGDPFTISLPLQGSIVVTSDLDAIRAVFAAAPETFGSMGAKVMGPILGAGSLLVLEGAAHRRARKLLNPPFHGDRMRAYGRVIRDVARDRIAPFGTGARFTVQDVAGAISLEVILQAVFGIRGTERLARFDSAVRATMGSLGAFVGVPFLRRSFGGLGPWARFQRRRAALAALVDEEIALRRRDGIERDDILSLLLSARYEDGSPIGEDQLFDQLLTLVAAGHETTMIALSWAFYWLHRTPDALARLQAELDALPPEPEPDALARLPYLDAVACETLRLYPVVPLVTRLLAAPFELKGHALPAGVAVGVATGLVHYRPDLYPEPNRFHPERFIGKTFGPSEYFPFGGGVRRCLGAAFAMYELKIVLGTLLRTLRVKLADDRAVPPAMRAAGVGPGRPVSVVVTERR
ncbi:MAG TPA: cytochrome P450 [Polyangia bacterium]|nr:cytochrome P450 [Polyangia bacterium]